MSALPPGSSGPEQVPDSRYAAYPRYNYGLTPYGSSAKLKSLMDGYYGISWVFGLNVLLAVLLAGASGLTGEDYQAGFILQVIVAVFTAIVIGFLTYPSNKKIAFGKDWGAGRALVASVLIGLQSALCCGIIGYAVMQQIALSEIQKYGLKGGFFGIKKKDMETRIMQLQQAEKQAETL